MLCFNNNGNNLHLNMYAKVEIPERKLTQVNTIEYDMKSYRFKTAIVNFTYVRLKGLEFQPFTEGGVGLTKTTVTQV